MHSIRLPSRVVLSVCVLFAISAVRAESPGLEAWIPADAIAYGKIDGLGDRLRAVLASDLRRAVEDSVLGRALRQEKKARRFFSELEKLEKETGVEAVDFLDRAIGREVAFAVRLGFQGPEYIVLARAESEEALEESLGTVREFVEARAGAWPFGRIDTHRDVPIEGAAGHLAYSVIGDVLAVSSRAPALRKVIDLAKGEEGASVESSRAFRDVARSVSNDAFAHVALRPKYLPGFDEDQKAGNFVAGLLFGGWLGVVQESELIVASLAGDRDAVDLRVVAKPKKSGLPDRVKSSFPAVTASSLLSQLDSRGVLAALQVHRGFEGFWDAAENLLRGRGLREMREFSGVMDQIFGRPFDEEVLPELLPTVTIVAQPQSYREVGSTPKPAIPGFAAILEMKNPERFGRDFRYAQQTIVGFINLQGAQAGGVDNRMLVEPEAVGDAMLYTVNPVHGAKVESPGLQHNFSPSLAIVGKRVVISSSRETARLVVEELAKVKDLKRASAPAADRLRLSAASLHDVLRANLDVFVAQNMVEKGHTKEQATAELEGVFELVGLLSDLEIEAGLEDDAFRGRIRLGLAPHTTATR